MDYHDATGMRDPYTMETHSGRFVDPLRIVAADVCIEDVAFHLASIRRFSGACRVNVADHSVRVARIVGLLGGCAACRYEGIMHDAHEAYIGDIIAPLGRNDFMRTFDTLKVSVQRAVDEALPGPTHSAGCTQPTNLQRLADQVSGILEARAYLSSKGKDWGGLHPDAQATADRLDRFFPSMRAFAPSRVFAPTSSEDSEREFLGAWALLQKGSSL